MLHLIRILIFGLVFTGITILSAVRGVVHPAHAAHQQGETVRVGVAGTVSSQHHGADALRE